MTIMKAESKASLRQHKFPNSDADTMNSYVV